MTETIVFDTEPLVAYADDEPGSEVVTQYLDAVSRGGTAATLNVVNATEVRYILARKYDRQTADAFLDWLWAVGVAPFEAESVWTAAADHVIDHNPALGDSFALATAASVDGTLIVGGDSEYDDTGAVTIERFREHGV